MKADFKRFKPEFYKLCSILTAFFILSLLGPAYAADRKKSDKLVIRGLNYLKEEDYIKGEQALKDAVRADHTNDSAYKYLGDLYARLKKYDEAVLKYQKAIEFGADSEALNFQIARIYYDAGQYEKAVKHYELLKDIRKYTHNAKFQYQFGESLRHAGKYGEALTALTKAVGIDETMSEGHYSLGLVYFEIRNYLKARKEFQKVIDLPDSDQTLKKESQEKLNEINKKIGESKIWRLGIPIIVMAILFVSYLGLRHNKLNAPPDEDEDIEDFYG